jgi:23S rRNA (uridine2552-2'-O)-methyltransferase
VTAWRKEQSRDRFFREAKRQRYRARSAFKLLELNRRLRLVRPGDAVVDLGAAPGSWSQVLAELVGPHGRVVAADLGPVEPLAGVATLEADICRAETAELIRAELGRPADAVVSDVSPQISGNRIADHARSIELADCSLALARLLSRPGAAFAVKVFRGEDFDAFVGRVRAAYRQARVVVPEATRQESRESYVCGLGLL